MRFNLIAINKFLVFTFVVLGTTKWKVFAYIGHKDDEVNHYFQRTDGITSGDAGFSIALNDKRTIWLFGDCHYNDYSKVDGTQPCLFQARNAAMIQPINDWTQNNTKSIVGEPSPFKSLFKAQDDKNRFYWPGHGVQIGDIAYVYCAELENTGAGGNLGFRNTGKDCLCKFNIKTLKVVGYTKLQDFNGIDFGAGFVTASDDYIYVYGQKGNGKPMSRSLYVSRFHKNKAEEPNFEFWNGKEWVSDVKSAHPLLDDIGNTMSVNKVKDKYLILSTEFSIQCDQGHHIYARHSDHITGPFTEKKAIHSIDEAKVDNHYPFFYMAISHPELIDNKNQLLITYSINDYGPCLKGCPNGRLNPDHYRLRGVRVNVNDLFKL